MCLFCRGSWGRARRTSGRPDPDGLDVDEFADAEDRKFASESAALDTAEGQPWIGGRHAIDEEVARLDAAGQLARAFQIARPEVAAATRRSAISAPTSEPGATIVRKIVSGALSAKRRSICSAQRVTFEACLRTTALPAISAGAAAEHLPVGESSTA